MANIADHAITGMEHKVKSMKLAWLAVIAATALVSSSAWADRGYGHRGWHGGTQFGVYLSAPLFWPYVAAPYAYSPYYAYSPIVIEQVAPPVYVERSQAQASPPAYWYFCRESQAYYPYVKQCPSAWQPVSPQPANPN